MVAVLLMLTLMMMLPFMAADCQSVSMCVFFSVYALAFCSNKIEKCVPHGNISTCTRLRRWRRRKHLAYELRAVRERGDAFYERQRRRPRSSTHCARTKSDGDGNIDDNDGFATRKKNAAVRPLNELPVPRNCRTSAVV